MLSASSDRSGAPRTPDEGPISFGRWLLELARMLAVALVLALAIRTFMVQPFIVPSASMEPTIQEQDRIVANKLVYHFGQPERGDVVVFDDPLGSQPTLVKRVIAVGGQTVNLVGGRVVVDGMTLDEPYTHGQPSRSMVVKMPYTVPEGMVWVMGDNRTDSADSRVFGAVSVDLVYGEVFWRFWPLDRIGPVR